MPFSEVLPRSSALVHHGGIGTTAQGLAAGVPQLVMPMSHDQPDNADRLVRMGVGSFLPPRSFQPQAVHDQLHRLTHSDEVLRRCREIAGRLVEADALAATCSIIERVASEQGVR